MEKIRNCNNGSPRLTIGIEIKVLEIDSSKVKFRVYKMTFKYFYSYDDYSRMIYMFWLLKSLVLIKVILD